MKRIYLNDEWRFAFDHNQKDTVSVRIPHTVKETPFNYFSEEEYQTVSRYERSIFASEEWYENKLLLTFEGVAHYAEVYVNGERVGKHNSGYTAFTVDITAALVYGRENLLTVLVDSRESLNTPPFGNVIDYMTYGGIYRDVYIDVKPTTYISDVFVRARANGEIDTDVRISGDISKRMRVRQSIYIDGFDYLLGEMGAESELTILSIARNIKPWHVDSPNLYTVKTELLQGKHVIDAYEVKVGFRDAEFKKNGFYLNGKRLKLRGLNRHQSYPYVGYAMPRSMQEMDAEVLKYELGLNLVRTSHYPQSQYFINRCDEIGLLVFTEIPGWQHIGDEKWQEQAVKNVEEMVLQYRNHPSIILWGVRINESPDNEELYTKTNEAAHRLDPTRQTGGVRNFRFSQLLEDVYTYNDFIHNGRLPGCEPKRNITPDKNKGYMITEYCGHMFPTKPFDCEEHRLEHALRHARVLNAVASHRDIAGSSGWCMADYNTHKDFGSGDRICYHGVTDMFRNHKLAAAVYSSQQSSEPVLEISSSMDIGEHPACIKGDIWAFTNADSIKMYKNDLYIKEYYPKRCWRFRHLTHSPVLIDDFVGDNILDYEKVTPYQAGLLKDVVNYIARHGYGKLPLAILLKAAQCMLFYKMSYNDIVDIYTRHAGDWGGTSTVYRFDAIKNGKVVKSVTKAPMTKASLSAIAYKTTLTEREGYDVTAIRISAVDENGNTLVYSSDAIKATVDGPVEIVGPDLISLKGGMGGLYLKTTGKAGRATLTLTSAHLGKVTIPLEVKIKK